jgi:3-polyprenyl-4-hydroxybenzoate decarboxylase
VAEPQRVTLAVTGASGVQYALRLLDQLDLAQRLAPRWGIDEGPS